MRLEPTAKPDHVTRINAGLITSSTILHLTSDELEGAITQEELENPAFDVIEQRICLFCGSHIQGQTCASLAADRTNTRVTSMFGMLEPAVWRLIERVVRTGVEHGKLVALCGELAADPCIGPLLAGLGVQELSMSPPAIVTVKAALHKHTLEYWRHLSLELLKAETAGEMQTILQSIT